MEFQQSAGHRNMSTARKARMRDRAERLGDIERRVLASWWFPVMVVCWAVGVLGLVGGLIEGVRL